VVVGPQHAVLVVGEVADGQQLRMATGLACALPVVGDPVGPMARWSGPVRRRGRPWWAARRGGTGGAHVEVVLEGSSVVLRAIGNPDRAMSTDARAGSWTPDPRWANTIPSNVEAGAERRDQYTCSGGRTPGVRLSVPRAGHMAVRRRRRPALSGRVPSATEDVRRWVHRMRRNEHSKCGQTERKTTVWLTAIALAFRGWLLFTPGGVLRPIGWLWTGAQANVVGGGVRWWDRRVRAL
jgi:hypothetical protein